MNVEPKSKDELMEICEYLMKRAQTIDPTHCTKEDIDDITSNVFDRLNLDLPEQYVFGFGMLFGVCMQKNPPEWLIKVTDGKSNKNKKK